MSTQYFKLKTLSPVHIGSGEKYSNLDYFTDGNILHFIDLDRFMNYLEAIDESLVYTFSELVSSNYFSLTEFINELKLNRKDYAFFVKESINCISSAKEINKHIKSGTKAFIPGSSLKGAIKNAVLYCHAKNDEKFMNLVKQLIANPSTDLLHQRNGKINNSIKQYERDIMELMHCIQVSDSIYSEHIATEILAFERKNMKSNLQYSEVIKADTECGYIKVKIDEKRLEYFSKNPFYSNLKNWRNCIREFITDLNANETDVFSEDNNVGKKNELPQTNALQSVDKAKESENIVVRLGKETGMLNHSISLLFCNRYVQLGYLVDDENNKKSIFNSLGKKYSYMYPKTRSVTSDEQLFGYIEMQDIKQSEYKQSTNSLLVLSSRLNVEDITSNIEKVKLNASSYKPKYTNKAKKQNKSKSSVTLEIGKTYDAVITSIKKSFCFAEIEGYPKGCFIHISKVANGFVSDIEHHIWEGKEVRIKVIGENDRGWVFSIKDAD